MPAIIDTSSWDSIRAIQFEDDRLILLDQRKLPNKEEYIECTDAHSTAEAIQKMVVRGAPAIGIAAAFGVVLCAKRQLDSNEPIVLESAIETLSNSRPTAVNLFWALNHMRQAWEDSAAQAADERYLSLLKKAHGLLEKDILANQTMGGLGASLLNVNSQIYTHCNAGALATGGYGTALGVIRSAASNNKIRQVYTGETRPWLQGARLTAWELMREGIPVKLSADSAAAQLFNKGKVDWVIVGADRIAANGDVANKIGTYSLAVLARYHTVKFMVVAPSTTFDLNAIDGSSIIIENRPSVEVTHIQDTPIAPNHCEAINPSFDITPNELIDAIVCEKGIIRAPFDANIRTTLST